jgi:hypothetical protein
LKMFKKELIQVFIAQEDSPPKEKREYTIFTA